MFHLIYVSTASRPFDESDLAALLKSAREANADRGLSGLLVHGGGNFMQLLEGEQTAVEETYERIKRDARHYDVQSIFTVETEDRWCADWSMAYADKSGKKEIDGFVNSLKNERILSDLSDDHVAGRIMRGFIDGNR
jgi:hypothetical protein